MKTSPTNRQLSPLGTRIFSQYKIKGVPKGDSELEVR